MADEPELVVGDVVWVKMGGFPHWPARVDRIQCVAKKGNKGVNKKYHMFYFGTHEIGVQSRWSLTPFVPNRDKFALYRGRTPQSLLEGVLEAEENPKAKPHDTLSNLVTDAQIWMVLGPEGQVDFRQRFPDRADAALAEIAKYNKKERSKRKRKEESSSEEEETEEKEPSVKEEEEEPVESPAKVPKVPKKHVESPAKVPKVPKETKREIRDTRPKSDASIKVKIGRTRLSLRGSLNLKPSIELTTIRQRARSEILIPSTREMRAEVKSRKRTQSEVVSTERAVSERTRTVSERSKESGHSNQAGSEQCETEVKVESDSGSASPDRKRRRTQSEQSNKPSEEPIVEKVEVIAEKRAEPRPQKVEAVSQQQSLFNNLSKIGLATTNRTREKQLCELTKCLRYSLRMSHINTVAAKKVLDDMSVLSPVVKDLESVTDLNISLELVSRLDSEPEVKGLATKLLDGIKCS